MSEPEVHIERAKNLKTIPDAKSFGFGKYFSDHLAISEYREVTPGVRAWAQPEIRPYQNLSLDPGAAVLHYGQALFEGLKAFRGVDGKIRIFRPQMNWQRMVNGAERLCMVAPPLELFMKLLKEFCKIEDRWIPAEEDCAFYLRPTLIGSEAFLGVRPSQDYMFYVMGSPVGSYYGGASPMVKIKVETNYVRSAPGGIGAAKTGGNYAASLKAALEAKAQGFAQVLWLDGAQKKFIEEVGTMNVFFKIKSKVITPPLDGTILPGVTRDSVLQLLIDLGADIEERHLSLAEILAAAKEGTLEEVFGTGTAASISPVEALGVNGQMVQVGNGTVGEISQILKDRLLGIQRGQLPDPRNWTVEVS